MKVEGRVRNLLMLMLQNGKPTSNATKIWVNSDGCCLANNNSKIPPKELKNIMNSVEINRDFILSKWSEHFLDKGRD